MAYSPVYDKGTRFTNYSSIHSADAFVGDYQVMYTPGSTSPPVNRASRKPSRFSKPAMNAKLQNVSQSYLLPSNMPNTSQVLPDQGALPNIQVHYNIPVDEKQIVASLRSLQKDLAEAMQTIAEITRERDEALHEIRLLRATSRKPSSPAKKQSMAVRVEEELFDLSKVDENSPRKSLKESANKKAATVQKQATVSDDARVLSSVPINVASTNQSARRASSKTVKDSQKVQKPILVEETEDQSVVYDEQTAASNTSRRRRRPSLDENMTSAYILPDITEGQNKQQRLPQVSKEAQQVLHSLEPEHVKHCEVCQRLTSKSKQASKPANRQSLPEPAAIVGNAVPVAARPDYTRKLAGFLDESFVDDPTMRPKVLPAHALARIRALMNAQFVRAKERHNEAWLKYDAVEAPLSSRKHAQIGKEMSHWAEKMEECRVHLDYLRDVEEGMADDY